MPPVHCLQAYCCMAPVHCLQTYCCMPPVHCMQAYCCMPPVHCMQACTHFLSLSCPPCPPFTSLCQKKLPPLPPPPPRPPEGMHGRGCSPRAQALPPHSPPTLRLHYPPTSPPWHGPSSSLSNVAAPLGPRHLPPTHPQHRASTTLQQALPGVDQAAACQAWLLP